MYDGIDIWGQNQQIALCAYIMLWYYYVVGGGASIDLNEIGSLYLSIGQMVTHYVMYNAGCNGCVGRALML